MSRHAAAATAPHGLFASLESAFRGAARLFETASADREAAASHELTQNQIRAASRHWLIG